MKAKLLQRPQPQVTTRPDKARVTVYRSTFTTSDDTLTLGPDGFLWFTVSRKHAEAFKSMGDLKGHKSHIISAVVDVSEFLEVDGHGMDISRAEATGIGGVNPRIIVLTDQLPGIYYRNVLDQADKSVFRETSDVLAVRDVSRITNRERL